MEDVEYIDYLLVVLLLVIIEKGDDFLVQHSCI